LRRFLLEETYEVFDAVRSGDADALQEELGDVLLQVLFHARIAEDAPQHPFTIDDVADTLLRKLGNRAPGVLAGESISLDEQLVQWQERKALEKQAKARNSVMDDVPTAQPALALAHKVIQRVTRAGLPADLIPSEITSITVAADVDAENALRTAVLEFMDNVRGAEQLIAAHRRGDDVPAELDVAPVGAITGEEWRAYWLPAVEELADADEVDELEEFEEPEAESQDVVDETADGVDETEGEAVQPDGVAESDVEARDDEPAQDLAATAATAAKATTSDGEARDQSPGGGQGDQPSEPE
jgi:XTP/dITP diphosphohydrolase